MKKAIVLSLFIIGLAFLTTSPVSAQMMRSGTSMMQMQRQPSVSPSAQDIQDIQMGQDLYTKLQNHQISCSQLGNNDFEKIGEYLMNQQIGDVNMHIKMNETMKQIMGDQGESNMHITIARSAINCNTNNQQEGGGGVRPMMGRHGANGMMIGGLGHGFGILWLIGYVIVLIDLILVGMWLWKQINKKH